MLRSPRVALIMLIAFGLQFAFFNFQTMYVLWAERVPLVSFDAQQRQQIIGGTYTFVGIVGIFTQIFVVGFLVKRVGEKVMVVSGSLLRAIAWSTMSLVPVLSVVLSVIPLFSMGGGITQPALIALLTYTAPAGQRGQAIGLLEGAQSLGRICGPLVAGFLYESINPSAPLLMAGLASLTVSVVALGLWRVKADPAHAISL
jgi:predicted MFS family arabinose efflux permease